MYQTHYEIGYLDSNATDFSRTAEDFIQFSRVHLNHLGRILIF